MTMRRVGIRMAAAVVVATLVGGGAIAYAQEGPTRPRRLFGGGGGAVHGELIIRQPDGTFAPAVLDRGTVTAASATSLTLQRPDGPTVTVALTAATTFRGIAGADGIRVGAPAAVLARDGQALTVAQAPPREQLREKREQLRGRSVGGQVTAAGADSVTIARRDGTTVTFAITAETRFKGITAADQLRLGAPAALVVRESVALVVGQRPQ